MKRLGVAAIIVMLAVGLSASAPALFTAIDEDQDDGTGNASADGDTNEGVDTPAGDDAASPHNPVFNPFKMPPGFTMPEDTPETAATPSSQSWHNRPKNAKHFDRLLGRDTAPAAAPAGTATRKEPVESAKGGDAPDYVIGLVGVAGLGAIVLLLFRRHH
jgi:hypothetical protein